MRLGLVMASLAGIGVALSADDDAEKWKQELAERARWWSLQAPAEWLPPDVSDPLWKEEPVDRFVYAKLEEQKLHPSEPADAETLARRLSFVLTGLPPKPERAAAFREAFANHPDTATTALVDELLRSPQFGERFARHWMDVVRYTDTYGYEWDIPAKGSWEYRDYLIRAFNEDVGFDQLIREQVAGDLLPHPRINAEAGLNESMIGPMFYHMGEHRHGSSLAFNGIHQEMIDNKIDAFSKAFLGMTVACARCHDHKLDAISQADYYALAGVFMTPRWTARSIDAPGKNAAALKELKRLRREIERRLAEVWGEAARGGLLSAGNLKDWATTNRASLDSSKVEGIEYLFGEIVDRPGAETWRELASEWKRTSDTRRTTNAENFTLISDFSQPGFPENWVMEGEGLLEGYVSDGTLLIGLEGKDLVSEFLPRGYHTHSLSSKLAGALRLPEPERFPKTKVSLELKGGEWAGYRAIPQNAFLNESPFFFDPSASAKWTTFAPSELKNGVTRVLTEITTASLNSNFPPRTGVARAGKVTLPNEDEGWDKRSWFSVTGIVAHDSAGTPADTLDTFALLYEGPPPETAEDDWQRLSDWLTATVNRWSVGDSRPGDVQILNWLLEKGFLPNDAETYPGVGAMVDRYREIEAGIEFPRSANSMDERAVEPVDYRLNVRGNVYEEGSKIHRNFLEVFEGRHEVAMAKGSGRLELAHYLSSRENPQTARVYVNR
ncbi:MAG: DUF1549 domain-containing protein, partial [Verrucomicrobiae bacterium]|nr:DUF1549 domain-containing protein [Verrucomicrobiae bacterium]